MDVYIYVYIGPVEARRCKAKIFTFLGVAPQSLSIYNEDPQEGYHPHWSFPFIWYAPSFQAGVPSGKRLHNYGTSPCYVAG